MMQEGIRLSYRISQNYFYYTFKIFLKLIEIKFFQYQRHRCFIITNEFWYVRDIK